MSKCQVLSEIWAFLCFQGESLISSKTPRLAIGRIIEKNLKKMRSEAKAIGMLLLCVILVSNDFSINQADIFPFLKGVTPLNMSER